MKLITDYPIASASNDHLHPRGTKNDNSRNEAFNDRLIALFPSGLSVLDLGCSGGGFVRSLLDRGVDAFGIDGSDYSQRHGRAEWGPEGCPEHLATADITKPFAVHGADGSRRFKVVTAWEVLEHIVEPELGEVFRNIDQHLEPGGLFIGSVSPNPDMDLDLGVEYHQTIRPYHWWIAKLAELGWHHYSSYLQYFGPHWVRGGLRWYEDGDGFYHPWSDAVGSFHLVLHRAPA